MKQQKYREKWRNTGETRSKSHFLTELSLSPPFFPSGTRGRILIQPRWLPDKPDGFDGYEVFGSRLSTIQRKFVLSLSLSLGWPYSSPGRGIRGRNVVKVLHPVFSSRRLACEEKVFGRGEVSLREYLRRSFRWYAANWLFRKFSGLRCSFLLPFCPINRQPG